MRVASCRAFRCDDGPMAKKTWKDLSPTTRRVLVAAGAADAALRLYALRDLHGRSDREVNGSRGAWVAGLSLVSSAGLLPVLYLLRGRR